MDTLYRIFAHLKVKSSGLSVSQVRLMKCGCEVHSHRVAIKVGPERETVPSATKQEKLWFFWVWDLRTERVQHQRPGHGVLKRPEHKWIHWLFLPVLVLGAELLVNFDLPCPSGTPCSTA